MSISTSPNPKDAERGLALQKYLLLHSQHDALRKHLSQISISTPTTIDPISPSQDTLHARSTSFSSSNSTSPPSPPTLMRTHKRHLSSGQRPRLIKRRSSLPAVIDDTLMDEIEEEEIKLKTVNLRIKSTLMEMLGCESVRRDARVRGWVQERLMEAELELRSERRGSWGRRSVGGVERGVL